LGWDRLGRLLNSQLVNWNVLRNDRDLDSINIHRTAIDLNAANIIIVADSLRDLYGLVITEGPAAITAEVGTLSDDTVVINYGQTIYGPIDTTMWKVYMNDEIIPEDTAIIDGTQVKLKLSSDILVASSVRFTYTQPASDGLRDIWNNYTTDESNFAVTNNTVDDASAASVIVEYNFEQNANDDYLLAGVYNGTASAGMAWSSDYPMTGSYIGDFNGTGRYIDLPDIPWTSKWSWLFTSKVWGNLLDQRVIVANDNLKLLLDAVAGRFIFQQINGTDTTTAYSNDSLHVSGQWTQLIVTGDTTLNKIKFFVNGVDETEDSIVDAGFDFTDSLRIGLDKNDTLQYWGYLDPFKGYIEILTPSEISGLYQGSGILDPLPVDTILPVLDTAKVITPTSLELSYSKNIWDVTPDTAAFKFREDGVLFDLSSPSIIGAKMYFTHDSITGGTTTTLDYTRTGNNNVKDVNGLEVSDYSVTVENSVPATLITQTAQYPWQLTTDDYLGNLDGTAGSGFAYYSVSVIDGTRAGNFDASNAWVTLPDTSLGDAFTPTAWMRMFNANDNRTVLAGDTWRIGWDNSTGKSWLEVYGESKVYSGGGYQSTSSWIYAAWAIDTTNNEVTFFINNDSVSTETIPSGLDSDGTLRWGAQTNGNNLFWGVMDANKIYGGELSTAQALSDYNNPSVMVDPGTPPEPGGGLANPYPAEMDLYFSQDYDDNTLGDYLRSEWIDDWNPNPVWRDSEDACNSGNADTVRIVDDGTDTVCAVTISADVVRTTCNFADDYSTSPPTKVWNLGGGEYFTSWFITDQANELSEIYYSFNIKWDATMDWKKGGKIMSIGGGPTDDQGSTKPLVEDGFSCLLMWKENGQLVWYIYHQDNTDVRYADTWFWTHYSTGVNYTFPKDTWVNVTIRVVNNTLTNGVANSDGFLEGWIDGVFWNRADRDGAGIEFTSYLNDGRGINRTEFAHFRGGGSTGYMGDIDCTTHFDDHNGFTYKSGQGYAAPGEYSDETKVLFLPWMK
jgi:hypothetical protein